MIPVSHSRLIKEIVTVQPRLNCYKKFPFSDRSRMEEAYSEGVM